MLAPLAGCGAAPPSTESVIRAWSEALNSGDNDTAAKLFAPGATVVEAGMVLRLRNHRQAVIWNAAQPCSSRIVSITTRGEFARATFVLGNRKASHCTGPGERTTAIFRVRDGKIVLWHRTPSEAPPTGPTV